MIKLSTIEKDFNEVHHLISLYDKEPELRDNAMKKLIKISALMTLTEIEEKLKQRIISDITRNTLIDKKHELIEIAERFH